MKALVVTCLDPFRPANHRVANIVKRRRSLRNLAPRTRSPIICQVNGQWISRQAWSRRINDGDTVLFVALPQGGGGGGSNPLKMILMLVVAFVAPYLAPMLAPAGMSAMGMSLITGAIGLVGNMLVNALIPPPKANSAQQASSLASPSPTYSIGAQGNSARLGSPIPVIYGRHQIFPDFAAMPYVEYAGNEQYLYQLLCIGQGEYDIEAIRIEDTPISAFPEITYEVTPPGGTVTMFPASVTTSGEVSGQEALTGEALGPFVANASGTSANYLAIDVVFSRGLYHANDEGGLDSVSATWIIEAQAINDVGVATGEWATLGTETYGAATTTPQRLSYKYAVTDGRYQVRMTRTDTKETDSRYGHELDWAGLRSYLPGEQSYGDVTMVAMRLRATNSLSSQASRKINFIVTRKLRTWSPASGWSADAVPTRSIAWAIADICKAKYGANLQDMRIDLDGLHSLDSVYTTRGDYFDAVFDSQSTIMEGLTQVCRAGRSIPFIQGGIVHAVRDAAATIPVVMFSQRNIVKNSLKLDYLMSSEDTADAVDVTYFDAQIWGERTVRATLPGGTSDKPATVKLFGVTTRQQAWNEGMYIAACNRYRRRIVSFSTEMEGFIPTIGDLIAVQHDMPRWGQSGEIVAWNAATKVATLSEPLDWSAGGPFVLAFRTRDGSPAGPYSCTAGADAYHVTLTSWTASNPTPDTDGSRERSHFAFGPANAQYIKCRMVSMRPQSAETVEITAVVESDFVHVADTGVAPSADAWQLPTLFTVPVVTDLLARSMPGNSDKMVISWKPAAGAHHYVIEQSPDGNSWTRLGETASVEFSALPLYGVETFVRVAAFGFMQGPWASTSYSYLQIQGWIPTPVQPVIYATPDASGNITRARIKVSFASMAQRSVSGLLVFISTFPYENWANVGSGGVGSTLVLNGAGVISTGTLEVLAGSTRDRVVVRSASDPYDLSINHGGRYWAQLPGGEWRKCVGVDLTAIIFDPEHDVDPVTGSTMQWAEFSWADSRQGDSKMAILSDGSDHEIIYWDTLDQDGPTGPFRLLNCSRGMEGTTPINADGKRLHYYPAPGAGTRVLRFNSECFENTGGLTFSGETDIDLNIPAGSFSSCSAAVFVSSAAGDTARSAIVPVIYGGAI